MSFEGDFLSMMRQWVQIKPIASRDGYGAPVAGNAIYVPAHITYRKKMVRRDMDERTLSTAEIQIPPPGFDASRLGGDFGLGDPYSGPAGIVPEIKDGAAVALPNDGTVRHVLTVFIYTDERGPHHQSVALT